LTTPSEAVLDHIKVLPEVLKDIIVTETVLPLEPVTNVNPEGNVIFRALMLPELEVALIEKLKLSFTPASVLVLETV